VTGTGQRRRLAAILAADAAGYSRLMAADENATVAALDSARAVFRSHIESNQGRVIDMAGDSVLAVFETAAGAVSAALAVQRALNESSSALAEDRRMRFRIGVHLGDVIEKTDGTVYGDGVNIAARLQALAEPGGVVVSQSIRTAVKGNIEAGFEDLGKQTVKNIAEPIRAYRIADATGDPPAPKPSVAEIDLSLPDKPSIAVLPFNNMSGDPEQEYFTDGVSEDVITELSRFRSLFVIARNSSFTYKGRAVDVRTVAKELGVRYVLEGSIRKAANRIRVTAQLIDSLTGNHIWAEKYDRVLEDVFEVQEEVTRAIVAAIAPQIDVAERDKARRRRPENLSAYELAVRASAEAWEAMAKNDQALREQAIGDANAALALDPGSAIALFTLGFAWWQCLLFDPNVNREAAFAAGLKAVMKSIELDSSNDGAYTIHAWLMQFAPGGARWDEALRSARRGQELNPNSVTSLQALGHIEGYQGDWARSLERLKLALRLSPLNPVICYVYQGLAIACLGLGEYANGVEYARQGIQAAPSYGLNHAFLAMNLVGLTEIEQARAAFDTAQRLSPGWIAARLRGTFGFRRPEDIKRSTVFLRVAAGLEPPENADAVR